MTSPARPVPENRRPRPFTMIRSATVTPLITRITFHADDIGFLLPFQPTHWVKLFFAAPDGQSRIGRAYTIRALRPDTGEVDIDFMLHGHGPAATWCRNAVAGDLVTLAGPRGDFQFQPDATSLFLVGDETALPAIQTIIEAAPAGLRIRLLMDVENAEEEQPLHGAATIADTWLHRNGHPGNDRLAFAFENELASLADLATVQFWMAGESGLIAGMRRSLLARLPSDALPLQASGYWKLGQSDHRDTEDS